MPNYRSIGRIAASLICLAACVGFAALWARSYYFHDALTGPFTNSKILCLTSWHGRLSFLTLLNNPPVPPEFGTHRPPPIDDYILQVSPADKWLAAVRDDDSISQLPQVGITFMRRGQWEACAPHWFLLLLAGALAIALKPKPRMRFSLRETLAILTVAAVVIGTSATFARWYGEVRR